MACSTLLKFHTHAPQALVLTSLPESPTTVHKSGHVLLRTGNSTGQTMFQGTSNFMNQPGHQSWSVVFVSSDFYQTCSPVLIMFLHQQSWSTGDGMGLGKRRTSLNQSEHSKLVGFSLADTRRESPWHLVVSPQPPTLNRKP